MNFELNSGQKDALLEIKKFFSGSDLFKCLSGSAGTGKTTILKEAISGQYFQFGITAPTHKAKKQASISTGLSAVTIHSLLGLRPDMSLEEFDNKKLAFGKLGEQKMSEFDIIICDEASMLNTALLEMMKKVSRDFGTKILFVGDQNQIPPVKELTSPVFNDSEIPVVRLTKVERQKESNPLMFLYDDILSDISSKKDLYKKETHISGTEGVEFFKDVKKFGNSAFNHFSSLEYKKDPSIYKILCYHNNKVKQWNNYIRKMVYGSSKAPLNIGEFLVGYNTIYSKEMKCNIIQNSYDYIVESSEFRITGDFEGFSVLLRDYDEQTLSRVFILSQNSYDKFLPIEQKLVNAAKSAKPENRSYAWKQYYVFKNRYLLLEDILDKSGNVIVKKDLDFSYALTVHKSQGSTYKNVFVDEVDIDSNRFLTRSEVNRLKYVAFTRPTNIAFVNS